MPAISFKGQICLHRMQNVTKSCLLSSIVSTFVEFNLWIWHKIICLAQSCKSCMFDLWKLTSPVFITHCEQAGLVCEFRQQAAALHHDSLRDHDDARHNPDDNNALTSPLGCTLEHQRVTNGIPTILGNATQC